MKNIHVLPTKNASKLYKINGKVHFEEYPDKSVNSGNQHIYITSDEEIIEENYCLDKFNQKWKLENKKLIALDIKGIKRFSTDNIVGHECKKIILTTDQDLIENGVQAIDDEFLQWFVKNSSCGEVEVKKVEQIPNGINFGMFGNDEPPTELIYKILIPKEEQTKCYCGHTNYCDCGPNEVPIEEPKQEYKDKKFQQNLVNKLRRGELTYENTSIYTVILDLVQGNGKEEVLRVFNEVIMEEPKQETLEEAAISYAINVNTKMGGSKEAYQNCSRLDFIAGAKSNAAKDYWFEKFKEK